MAFLCVTFLDRVCVQQQSGKTLISFAVPLSLFSYQSQQLESGLRGRIACVGSPYINGVRVGRTKLVR